MVQSTLNKINRLAESNELTAAVERGKAQALTSNSSLTDAQLLQHINNLKNQLYQIDLQIYATALQEHYNSFEYAHQYYNNMLYTQSYSYACYPYVYYPWIEGVTYFAP